MTEDQDLEIGHCLFQEANDAFFILNPNNLQILKVNPAAQRLTGYRKKELEALPLEKLIFAPTKSTLEKLIRACQTTIVFVSDEFLLTAKTGHQLAIYLSVSKIHTEPEPLALLTLQDISRLRKAEQALRESEQRFRQLAESIDVVFWFLSLNPEKMLYVNPAFENIWGVPAKELFEKPRLWADMIHEEDRKPVLEALETLFSGQKDRFELEYRIVRPDGQIRWILGCAVSIRNPAGQIYRVSGISQDITSRKKAEEERLHYEKKIQQTEKLETLGILVGGVAHEFNNCLAGVIGHTDLALMDLPPVSPIRESLLQIKDGSMRLADLCKQMLAYSGKGRFSFMKLNLSQIVEEMFPMIRASISRKAVFQMDLEKDLPPIEGDPAQIRQILLNLVANASEALHEDQGAISIRTGSVFADQAYLKQAVLAQDLPEGAYVYIEVTDSGCGIDNKIRSRIFDPFFSTKFLGRGLGLAEVLGLVRQHRGTIFLDSEPRQGTTFRILFQAMPVELVESEKQLES